MNKMLSVPIFFKAAFYWREKENGNKHAQVHVQYPACESLLPSSQRRRSGICTGSHCQGKDSVGLTHWGALEEELCP